ncbi:Uncharacterised protein [Vibrio cholerae]|nr:Uncharacterised protein [Vibrio cholerae]
MLGNPETRLQPDHHLHKIDQLDTRHPTKIYRPYLRHTPLPLPQKKQKVTSLK